jgi:RES domain-containing protein
MELYRLSRDIHGKVLSGKGASISGGRWNSPGTEIIYTAANRSLAMAEVAVHFSIATLPAGYMMMTLYVPEIVSVTEVDIKTLPEGWNQFPPLKQTQLFGDQFITDGKRCLLKVPSAVTQGDFNFLINPLHPEFKKIKITEYEPFPFDRRLFK